MYSVILVMQMQMLNNLNHNWPQKLSVSLIKKALSVRKAGTLTGFAAADISRIRKADLGRFTIDRLVKLLGRLNRKVEIKVSHMLTAEADAHASA